MNDLIYMENVSIDKVVHPNWVFYVATEKKEKGFLGE